MHEEQHGRRSFLAMIAAVGTGAVATDRAAAAGADSRGGNKYQVKDSNGIKLATESSSASRTPQSPRLEMVGNRFRGPTACIVGGIHGDEDAGIEAAHDITEWSPPHGRLVVIPEANPRAIAADSRSTESGDLNRQFVVDRKPTSPLAQRIWRIVRTVEPDICITLHESKGIRGGEPSGVGQAVFRSPNSVATDAARMGIRRANKRIDKKRLKFSLGEISGPEEPPSGLLTEKATYEAGIDSFIVETYEELDRERRVRWQKLICRGICDYYDHYD